MIQSIRVTRDDQNHDVHLIREDDAPRDLVVILGMLRAAEHIALHASDTVNETFTGPQLHRSAPREDL
jgi:hypothetical protein